jgi:hypothetical protein
VRLYGTGPVAIADDRGMADRLGWPLRKRSCAEPTRVLRPRAGDPRCEPWLAPPGWHRCGGPGGFWIPRDHGSDWTYLDDAPGVSRYLEAFATQRPGPVRLGICGLGRVGGTAAAVLAAMPTRRSGVGEILLQDADQANEERWAIELSAVATWRGSEELPVVRRVAAERMFEECDVFLFAAASAVPPIGSSGDVRMVQLEPNRKALGACLALARQASFTGLFLVASDPVECIAQAAFHDSNSGPDGAFTGDGLAPERVAGLALGVMWARALAEARDRGWSGVARRGGVFGPHTTDVEVFDDLLHPDPEHSAALTRAARHGNFLVRETGHLPYVGPAVSSLALTIPRLLAGREVLASVFLDGTYFGGPSRQQWGLFPVGHRLAREVQSSLLDLHQLVHDRMVSHGLAWGR